MNQLFNKGVPFYDNGASTCRGGSSFSSLDFRMGRAVKKTSPAWFILTRYIGPPQVKCQLLISSIFDAMNFQHFSEMP